MAEDKLCRICLSREKNLISVFESYDNDLIYKMIKFSIDITITRSDAFPKHICGVCLEEIKIATNVKRKGLNTNKILKDLVVLDSNGDIMEDQSNIVVDDEGEDDRMQQEEMEYDDSIIVQDDDNIIEECYTQSAQQKKSSKYLVYEEIPEHPNQPKFYYLPTPSSIKITNTSYFEYNESLKKFVEDYLENKPNLEIIKIVNEDCIKEIERILLKNDESQDNNDEYSEDYLEEVDVGPSGSKHQQAVTVEAIKAFQRPPTNFGINRGPQTQIRTVTVNNNRYTTTRPVVTRTVTIPATRTVQTNRVVSRPPAIQPTITRVSTVKKNGFVNKK